MDFYQGIFGSLANKMPTELAFFFENRGKYDANGTLGVAKNVWTGAHIPFNNMSSFLTFINKEIETANLGSIYPFCVLI